MKAYTIIVKVEITNLLDLYGNFDEGKMDRLCRVVSGIRNSGIRVAVVSSGAIYLGSRTMGTEPANLSKKQALAAIGQVQLMELYQHHFSVYNQVVAQILITADVIRDPIRNRNARNTLEALLSKGAIPIVNENDPVSTEDIELDDNYYLVLRVASLVNAQLLLLHHRQDGKYLLVNGKDQPDVIQEDDHALVDRIGQVLVGMAGTPGDFPSRIRLAEYF